MLDRNALRGVTFDELNTLAPCKAFLHTGVGCDPNIVLQLQDCKSFEFDVKGFGGVALFGGKAENSASRGCRDTVPTVHM